MGSGKGKHMGCVSHSISDNWIINNYVIAKYESYKIIRYLRFCMQHLLVSLENLFYYTMEKALGYERTMIGKREEEGSDEEYWSAQTHKRGTWRSKTWVQEGKIGPVTQRWEKRVRSSRSEFGWSTKMPLCQTSSGRPKNWWLRQLGTYCTSQNNMQRTFFWSIIGAHTCQNGFYC